MINPLYLPELREMLADGDAEGLREFCDALHPARIADFMEGLSADEAWRVLKHSEEPERNEIFHYFDPSMQLEILETMDRGEVAELVAELAPDDRVDLLKEADPEVVDELLPLLPTDERRDILHLTSYAEGTAGAVMTTEFAKLSDALTVRQALEELGRQAEELETIYYLYIVDEFNHLRGLVSARQLVSAIGKPDTRLREIMETGLVTVDVEDDQEEVAHKVAHYDLAAIPVLDPQNKMLGIITYDDIIDVVREEATEDAHRIAAVQPLEEGYLETEIFTLSWKRGIWLAILFFAALLTAYALQHYEGQFEQWGFLILFIPLVISCGGNTGNQSATLIITALTTGDITLSDWKQVIRRELIMGVILGTVLGLLALASVHLLLKQETRSEFPNAIWVVPLTTLAVMVCGAVTGTLLPLMFQRLGLDPAMMSNPFVAGIIDILGIVIYMNIAYALLS